MKQVWNILITSDKDELGMNISFREITALLVDKQIFLIYSKIEHGCFHTNEDNRCFELFTLLKINNDTGNLKKSSLLVDCPDHIFGNYQTNILLQENNRLYLKYQIGYPLFDITNDIKYAKHPDLQLEPCLYPAKKQYIFGDKEVYMKSPMRICCIDKNTKKQLWTYRIHHYLYADIECRNDIVYLATAGNGGAFYALSLITGDLLFDLHLGDCDYYFWHQNNLLIANRTKKKHSPNWILVDAKTGDILEQTKLIGEIVLKNENSYYIKHLQYNRLSKEYEIYFSRFDL